MFIKYLCYCYIIYLQTEIYIPVSVKFIHLGVNNREQSWGKSHLEQTSINRAR